MSRVRFAPAIRFVRGAKTRRGEGRTVCHRVRSAPRVRFVRGTGACHGEARTAYHRVRSAPAIRFVRGASACARKPAQLRAAFFRVAPESAQPGPGDRHSCLSFHLSRLLEGQTGMSVPRVKIPKPVRSPSGNRSTLGFVPRPRFGSFGETGKPVRPLDRIAKKPRARGPVVIIAGGRRGVLEKHSVGNWEQNARSAHGPQLVVRPGGRGKVLLPRCAIIAAHTRTSRARCVSQDTQPPGKSDSGTTAARTPPPTKPTDHPTTRGDIAQTRPPPARPRSHGNTVAYARRT